MGFQMRLSSLTTVQAPEAGGVCVMYSGACIVDCVGFAGVSATIVQF